MHINVLQNVLNVLPCIRGTMENVKNPDTFWVSVTVRISTDTHYSRAPSCLLRNRHRNRRPSLSRAAFVCRAGLLCDNGHTRSRLERHGGGGENGLNLCNIFDAPLTIPSGSCVRL